MKVNLKRGRYKDKVEEGKSRSPKGRVDWEEKKQCKCGEGFCSNRAIHMMMLWCSYYNLAVLRENILERYASSSKGRLLIVDSGCQVSASRT